MATPTKTQWTLFNSSNQRLFDSSAGIDQELVLANDDTYVLAIRGYNTGSITSKFNLILPPTPVTTLPLGTATSPNAVAGQIKVKGQNDIYTFSGEAGQRLYLDILDRTPGRYNYITIDSPTGERIFGTVRETAYYGGTSSYELYANESAYNLYYGGISDTGLLLEPFVLKETGAYKITVDFSGENLGSYGFSLLDLDKATNLTFNTNINGGQETGEQNVTLATGQETKLYKFAASAGTKLYADSLATPTKTQWTLFNSSNQRLFDSSAGIDQELVLANDDTYVLAIRGYNSGSITSEFNLILPPNETTAISVGTGTNSNAVNGQIKVKGQNDIYTFSGEVGQRLYLDILNQTPGRYNYITIDSPTGERVFGKVAETAYYGGTYPYELYFNESAYNLYYGGISLNGLLDPFVLKENGTYKVTIDFSGENLGSYGFSLLDLDKATNLTFNANINGGFETGEQNVTFTTGQETKLYKFTATAGTKLYADSLANPANTKWTLYNSSNQRLFDTDANKDQEVILTNDDTYVLAIRGYNTGSTTSKFNLIKPPNETTAISLGTDTNSNAVNGEINVKGEIDTYTFTGVAGQQLFFDALAGSTDIRGKLFSPTGVEILNNSTNTDWNPLTLTETGIYRFIIDGNNDTTGNYSFRLLDIVTTSTIEMGTSISGSLNPGNEADLYHFTGRAGQKLNFDLAASSWTNANWVLYGLNNQIIAAPNGSSPDFNIMLPASGLYTLAVRGNSIDTVNYNFTVNDTTPLPVATTGLGTVQSGTISAGQVITQTFTAKAGTRIYFDSQLANNAPLQLIVINPDGTNVFVSSTSTDLGPVQLQQTGTYTFKVQGTSASATGSYQFALIDLPTETPDIRGDRRVLQFSAEVTKPLEPGRLMHEYTFTGKTGQRLYYDGMFTDGASFGTDAVTSRLISPNGNVIFNPGYGEGYSTANVGPFTLTETGTYTLLLGGEKDTPTGYRFRLWDLADAHELELNKKVKENLLRGNDTNLYKFTGSTGQRLYFDAISGSNANWTLYRPGNQEVLASHNINTDFEVVLPTDGEYILAVSGYSNTPTQYSFQVFGSKSNKVSIITPGDGKSNSSLGEDLGVYQVRLNVDDGRGGNAEQNYLVRVLPEIDNHAPSIITQAVTKGFDGKRYTYDVDASDADGDTLTYRLIDAPKAMFIDDVTGMIVWSSPEVGTHKVTVRVEDSRGGFDTQTFDLFVSNIVPGTIKGNVYADIDGDGKRDLTNPNNMTPDSRIIIGDRFKENYVAYDLGVPSGVPLLLGGMTFKRDATGQVDPNTLLIGGAADSCGGVIMELAIKRGDGGHIIGFDDDDDPTTPYVANYYAYSPYIDAGLVYYTESNKLLASSLKGILRGLQQVPTDLPGAGQLKSTGAGNTFSTVYYSSSGAITSVDIETTVGDRPGGFVYMSSNAPNFDTGAGLLLAEWNKDQINAYEVDSEGNPISATGQLFIGNYDGASGAVVDPVTGDLLFNAMGGYNNVMVVRGLGKSGANEPGLANWLVYADLDADGTRDADEAFTYTDAQGNYSLTLAPGNYRITQEIQPGWTQTSPTNPSYWQVTLAANEKKTGVDFGNTNSNLAGENVAPEFTSTAPTQAITTGEKFLYKATAVDLNADELSFELVLKPEGMAIAPNGTISWRPGNEQVGKHQVIVRVSDAKGGVDLQSFEVEVKLGNRAPNFVSITPDTAHIQANKQFQYQTKALDLDGDTIAYEIVSNTSNTIPSGVAINRTTGLVTWTPTTAQTGGSVVSADIIEPWRILIRATDGKGGEDFQLLNIIVDPVAPNRAPVINSTPRTSTKLGNTYYYQIAATDLDGDTLTYSLDKAPNGMTINNGVIVWNPDVNQFGNQEVVLRVSDGTAATPQAFTINVSNQSINRAPSIISAPNFITNLEKEYQYNLTGTDPDGDLLLWSLDNAPDGMVIDPRSGALRWQPTSTQIGEHTVSVRLSDAYGLFAGQEFTLLVTGVNTPPAIVSTPITRAAQNQAYKYTVVANDPENDELTFSLGRKPAGMTIDDNGIIRWTPQSNQIGQQEVEVLVQDGQGAVTSQVYTIEVGTTAINTAPSITSTPVYIANTGSAYQYQVQATDPDAGDRLTYQLLSAPTGMNIDAATGLLTWANPVAGNYRVVVGAVDAGGLGAAQGFSLTARANNAPVIRSTPMLTATPGSAYAYDVIAADVDGDRLTYTLDQVSVNKGITLDALGRLRWNPTVSNVGTHRIVVSVSDGITSTPQQYDLVVAADDIAPKVRLIANYDQVDLGETVIFQARATDNIRVAGLQLLVNGNAVVLDANGMARVAASELRDLNAVAVATDTAGNTSQATFDVIVRNPNSVNPPQVTLNLGAIAGSLITAPVNIVGTINDDDLKYYTLEVAPVAGGEFKEIFRGTTTVNNNVLGKFDPSLLQNDSYILRLTVYDQGNNASTVEDIVDVGGELKLGNFRLSFTDLTVPVTGIPITLTRTYDTLTSGITDDFGYGWRMEFRDTDLRTSLRQPSEEEQLLGYQSAFKDGTRVYITLPGGKREAFTFRPTVDPIFGLASAIGGVSSTVYKPAFVGDKGVTSTLTVKDARILRKADTNEYVGLNGGVNYNPADVNFGNVYVLTTKEGVVYEIDAATGDLLTVTDTNGNKLTYTDEGIYSSTGKQVIFERDAQGRIAAVKDPMGELIRYGYNANGDLVSVTDREGNTTKMEYNQQRSHYLDKIIDPLNRTGIRNEYGDDGRLKEIVDVNGQKVEMSYDQNNSKQVVKDARGYSTTYIYDSRGNVLQEIDALGGITTRTYDDENNLLSETDADGVTTKYTYDNRNNVLTIEDVGGKVVRMAYNQRGQALSITSPTGLTIFSEFDSRGNLIKSTNADGLVTTYDYDGFGRLIRQVVPDSQVMEYSYDAFGNPNHMVDSRGNVIDSVYDANGRIKDVTAKVITEQGTYNLTTSYVYDKQGRTTQVTDQFGNVRKTEYNTLGQIAFTEDSLGNRTQYFYDSKGRLTDVILPDNTPDNPNDNPRTNTKYDNAGNVIEETSATGLTTRYIYDELGRLSETILPDQTPDDPNDNPKIITKYTAAGRIKEEIDIFGNSKKYWYDSLGRLQREQDVLGNYTTYTYNIGGQIETVTDAKNRTTRFIYDELARAKETIFFDGSKNQVTYDELGRLKTETNQLGQTNKYEYDEFSRIKATVNALNERTEYAYDNRGKLIQVTDALQQKTKFEYDQYGRQVATIAQTGERTEVEYDRYSRVKSETDANQHTKQYFYNNLSQLTTVELADKTRTNYTYDIYGRLTGVEDANKNLTQYEYDLFNRQVASVLPMGQRSQTDYNNLGQVKSYKDFNGDIINYTYDKYGRLDTKSFSSPNVAAVSYTYDPITSQLATVKDGRGVTRYSYDNKDRLASITNPDGQTIGYGYDLLGNLTSQTTSAGTINYSYDALNRLDKVIETGRTLADYDYNAVGSLIRTTLANGIVENRSYDERNRLKYLENRDSAGNVLSSYSYTLDAVGNRKKVVENTGRVVEYAYDELNRLTQEKITDTTSGNRTIGYSYDLVGNRLSRTDSAEGLTTYVYDRNNRLTSLTQGNKVTQFTYDNNGSMKSRRDGTQTVTYDWINDGENRLVGVTTANANGTSRQQYIYDADGNRVASINNGVRTNYLVDPMRGVSQVLLEYDTNGQITAEYTYGMGLIKSERSGNETFYHTDGLGSTRLLTNATGQIIDTYTYDAYGRLLSSTGTSENSYQFAGEQRDSETGLDYLRARYYDSDLGRFISKDAFAGFMDDPMSQHDYQYAHANPVNFTDPTGYSTNMSEIFAVIGITGFFAGLGLGGANLIGSYAAGASGEELLNMTDQWVAGFANFVTFGASTHIRRWGYGDIAEQNHSGVMWNFGQVSGAGAAMILGAATPDKLTFNMGRSKWIATTYDVIGTGVGAWQTGTHIREGRLEWSDAFTLTPLFSFASSRGIKQLLGAGIDADDALRKLGQMEVNNISKWGDDIDKFPLWRAVKDPELIDISNQGIFRSSHPGWGEVKYFSETPEAAASYAQQAYRAWPNEGPYTILETSIPKDFITPDMKVRVDGNVNAVVIPEELFPYLNPPTVWDSIPITELRQ
ncbi:putative Ig domain-containing protein [Nostoc sp. NIES-2111]